MRLEKAPMRVGYVVKRYPRYSETFIVNEILAHEEAGLDIEIFSLYPSIDAHFQDRISSVRAPVNHLYIPENGLDGSTFWTAIEEANQVLPGLWTKLEAAKGEEAVNVYKAVLLARMVHIKGINHLHAHFASVTASVTRLAGYFAGVPYTFTAHAKDIFHESVKYDDLKRKVNDATSAITVSNYNLNYLNRICGNSSRNILRIYNGLDLGQFPFRKPGCCPPNIVSVGRLVEKKGFNDLIDACAILASHGHSFSCQIIGTGPLETQLRSQIEQLNMQKYVKLTGPLPRSELIKYVQDSAVFAAPCIIGKDSDRDGLPTVLLEAMALGTPCISTDVTGIPEVLRHGETGLMVPQHNPAELAKAIESLFADPELCLRIAINARQNIEKEFDIRRNSACIREVFNNVGLKIERISKNQKLWKYLLTNYI